MKLTMAEELDYLREVNRQLKERLQAFTAPDPFADEPVQFEWKLAPRERDVFRALTRAPIMPYDRLCQIIWGDISPATKNTLKVLVHNLRKKLRPFGINILTHHGEAFQLTGFRE